MLAYRRLGSVSPTFNMRQLIQAAWQEDGKTGVVDHNQAMHIVGGDSAAGCLRFALHLNHDRVLVNEDLLSGGPAPATTDLGVWRSVRENYIRGVYVDWPNFSFDEYADNGLLMNVERLARENTVVVWAGLGLPDQLLLAWVIFLFDRLNLDLSKLLIVQFEKLPTGQEIFSTAELHPESIRDSHPEPRQLDSQEVKELKCLWKVYTSDDPVVLARYVAGSSPMPIAHRAASQLLYRYPDLQSGLGVWEERLLRHTLKHGPRAMRVIGHTMGSESLDQQGHMYLLHRLARMATLRSPLVSLTGSPTEIRDCEVELTSFGKEVSAGNANNVSENGVDDWIGGVHLTDKGRVTFRSGDSLVLS
jgi:hypothetical protein